MRIKKNEKVYFSTVSKFKKKKYLDTDNMTEIKKFRKIIIQIRDILRSPGISITGMDSMRHICIYLFSRYCTRKRIQKSNITKMPMKLSWETLYEKHIKNESDVKSFSSIINVFRNTFNTVQSFTFDIKDNIKHNEIIGLLSQININVLDVSYDILGWVYEQHLSTGSSSSSRDLGQFFTNRQITKYMIELCKPKIDKNGKPETFCDPAMGTGGFLTGIPKYYKHTFKNSKIDWVSNKNKIHGCDTDVKVSTVARVNMFLESNGVIFPNLQTNDSLYNDLPAPKYDILLANMPFGIKGLQYDLCCDRIKSLNIKGTRSETLFLQLIMVSLKKGGRCAVIVPNGILVNLIKFQVKTRQYLCEHFSLRKVIQIDGQAFMNTNVKASILYFENTSEPSTTISFLNIKLKNGNLHEYQHSNATIEQIRHNKYKLDYRQYVKNSQKYSIQSEFKTLNMKFKSYLLSDLVNLRLGKGHKKYSNVLTEKHTIPYFGTNGLKGYVSKSIVSENKSTHHLIVTRKLSVGHVEYCLTPCVSTDSTFIVTVKKPQILRLKYLYYWLLFEHQNLANITHGIKPGIRKKDFLNLSIDLPTPSVQNECIKRFNNVFKDRKQCERVAKKYIRLCRTKSFIIIMLNDIVKGTNNIDEIVHNDNLLFQTQSLKINIQNQIQYKLHNFYTINKQTYVPLSSLVQFNPESIHTHPISKDLNSINYIDLSSVKNENIKPKTISLQQLPKRAKRRIRENDILWGIVRPLNRNHVQISNLNEDRRKQTVVSNGFLVIRNKSNNINSTFLYYILTSNNCVNYLHERSSGTGYPVFSLKTMKQFMFPLVNMEAQNEFVKIIKNMRKKMCMLSELIKTLEKC